MLIKLARIEITHGYTSEYAGYDEKSFIETVGSDDATEYDIDGDDLAIDLDICYRKFPGAEISIGIIHKVI